MHACGSALRRRNSLSHETDEAEEQMKHLKQAEQMKQMKHLKQAEQMKQMKQMKQVEQME